MKDWDFGFDILWVITIIVRKCDSLETVHVFNFKPLFLFYLISIAWSEVIFDGAMNAATKGTTLTGDFEIKAEDGVISVNIW